MPELLVTRVQNALEVIRPEVQADGGDFEFIKLEGTDVYIKFKGACIGCPFSFITLSLTIEESLQKQIPEITEVIALED